jgi:Transglutaminase-like superfamily
MARYGLAKHVFVCRDEEYIVILDLKRDRYFALEAARTTALIPLLPGWPAPSLEEAGAVPDLAVEEAAAPLLRQGWLLDAGAASKDATPVRPSAPETDLLGGGEIAGAKLDARTVVAFLVASIFAKLALRFRRLEWVVRRVAERNAAHADRPFDIERARRLVDAFGRMRAFLFSSREECLHDSLAVLEFLARHEIFPSWVFGVRARPFAAHCWVQHGEVVFNDSIEHSSTYTPIMVV